MTPQRMPEANLRRLWRLGLSPAVIARRSPTETADHIKRRLRRLGLTGRRPSPPGAVDKAVALVKRGAVPIDAAERTGANVYAVYSRLKLHGIEFMRGTSTPEHRARSLKAIARAHTPKAQAKAKRTQRRAAVRGAFKKFDLKCSPAAMKFCVAAVRKGHTGQTALVMWLLELLRTTGAIDGGRH